MNTSPDQSKPIVYVTAQVSLADFEKISDEQIKAALANCEFEIEIHTPEPIPG